MMGYGAKEVSSDQSEVGLWNGVKDCSVQVR